MMPTMSLRSRGSTRGARDWGYWSRLRASYLRVVPEQHVTSVPCVEVGEGRRGRVKQQHAKQALARGLALESTHPHVRRADIEQRSTVENVVIEDRVNRLKEEWSRPGARVKQVGAGWIL